MRTSFAFHAAVDIKAPGEHHSCTEVSGRIMAEAPAEKSLEILSQELTCSLCSSHYDSPKVLQCCHYFCQSCLSGQVKQLPSGPQVTCPECNITTTLLPTGVNSLPDVPFVKHLKELHTRMAMIQRKTEAVCESCSADKAGYFCHQCADFMCDECAKSHSRMTKKYPGHRVASLDQLQENGARTIPMKPSLPSRCACAGDKALSKVFCRDCRQLVCRDCIQTQHSGHRYDQARKCASQSRRQLQQSLFPLRIISQQFSESLKLIENSRRDISSQGVHVAQSIQSYFNEVISLLEKERQSLLAKSAKLVQQKLESLDAQEKTMTAASNAVQNVIEYCKQSVELVSDEEILMLHKELQNRVQEECSKHQKCSEQLPCAVANIAVQTSKPEELVKTCQGHAKVYLFPSENNKQVHMAEVGKETTHCIMDSSDLLYTPHLSSFTASLVSVVDGSVTQAAVTAVGKGMYKIRYTPLVRGRHQLWIQRDGSKIPDSPFPVFATISPSLLGMPVHSMDGLKHPYSAVFGAKNQLYVTQSGGNSIQKFWRNGERVVSESFTSQQQPKCPTGMAVDSEGYVYVVNISTHTLSKFNQEGKLVGEVGHEGSDQDELNHPSGVAVVSNRIYVCDRNNDRVKVYTKELKLVDTFGSHGRQSGEMNWPYDITSDGTDHLYIADSDNHRVQIFSRSGRFVRSFGKCGSECGSLKRPTGVCIGHDKLLYVTEYGNHRVSVFHRDGTYMGTFGSYGSKLGELCYPVGVTVDRDGFVYVCDQGNNRIQVF